MKEFGVYVHIPFCASKCDYCDFATWTDKAHLVDDYVQACITDISSRYEDPQLPRATSIFFGGGTPSLIPANSLMAILDAIPRLPGAEITVECNPDTLEAVKLAAYMKAGVNRLSIGMQSMLPHVLESLGRTHDPRSVKNSVLMARDAGFSNINLDVIYGAAGESLDDWCATLDGVLALGPDHVSAYGLTVEAGTPLAGRITAGLLAPPDDDDQAAKYDAAEAALTAAGLVSYEISNWARPGFQCAQNNLYWNQGEYLGIGCAAHGHTRSHEEDDWRRWWNVRSPQRYIEAISAGNSAEAGNERLDPAERAEEAFVLALRTSAGVPLPERGSKWQLLADELAALDLIDWDSNRMALTAAGRRLAGDITSRFLALSTH